MNYKIVLIEKDAEKEKYQNGVVNILYAIMRFNNDMKTLHPLSKRLYLTLMTYNYDVSYYSYISVSYFVNCNSRLYEIFFDRRLQF